MSLRSAPERTREGGRRRSARDVSRTNSRSCAARKPWKEPQPMRRCGASSARAHSLRIDSAPEVPSRTVASTSISGGKWRLCNAPRDIAARRLSWTNWKVWRVILSKFARVFKVCPGQIGEFAFQSSVARENAQLKKSLTWLATNQDRTQGLWPAYSLNKQRDPSAEAFLFMSDAATGFAVLALTQPPTN